MFERVVNLYRKSGRPIVEEGAFSFDGPVTRELRAAIEGCQGISAASGYFEEGPDYNQGLVSFTWRVSANEFGRFYRDVYDFIEGSEKLSAGQIPEHYYLIQEDLLGGVDPPTPELGVALAVSRMIGGLAKLSLSSSAFDSGRRKLLFVLPAAADVAPRTVEIDTTITRACLHADKPDVTLLEAMTAEEEGRLHINEHRQLFRISIASVLARKREDVSESPFQFLVCSWAEVLKTYQMNADCYVQKFSFEKLRGEVARIELDYATRMAAVLGDGSGKILALPLSLGGLAGVWATTDVFTALGLVVGLVLVSLLLSGLLHNQKLASARVEAGFALAMGDVDGSLAKYPKSLQSAIDQARKGFTRQLTFLRKVHNIVHPLAWFPPIIGTVMVVLKFGLSSLYAIVPALLVCIVVFAYMRERKDSSTGR
ncbi:MAG: hypothetical protein ABL934_02220 [Lysobacteraceae bacterium]